MKLNIGILGASGFVGKELIKQLVSKNLNVYIFTRQKKKYIDIKSKNIFFVQGKFVKKDLLNFINKVDTLINLIAETDNLNKMNDINVKLLKKIILLSKKKINKLLHISSVSVYGYNLSKTLTENSKCLPIHEYGKTKLIAEKLLIEASNKDYFKSIIIRPSNILGRNMNNQSIFKMIALIDKNKFIYFENKDSNMNYIYVNDLCKVIVKLIKYNNFKKYEILNFSNKIKLSKFIGIILNKLKKKNNFINLPYKLVLFFSYFYYFFNEFPLKPSRVKALNVRVSYSNKKIKKIINFKKHNNIERGLLEIIEKFNEKKNLFRC